MKYAIKGMSCAVCAKTVEKAVNNVDGTCDVNVNLLANSLNVEGNYDEKAVFDAVKKAGYGISQIKKSDSTSDINKETTKNLLIRFIISIVLLVPIMVLAMSHGIIHIDHMVSATIQMILTFVVIIINFKYFIKGIKAIFIGMPNMDTLVSIGAGTSFVYSLVLYINAIINHKSHGMLYFESAATILTLITFGKMLESYSKGKTKNAIQGFVELAPKLALVERTGEVVEIPVSQVQTDDIFVVKPGGQIPVDGIIIDGYAAVDESMITGESVPVDKNINDEVFTATINTNGYIKCKATKTGNETSLAQIIKLVEEASTSKAPIARIADKVAGVFVPAVLVIAFVTFVVWMIVGQTLTFALTRAVSVLVISCPCALGLATPVAIMVGNGVAANLGILFKNATFLEKTGHIKTLFLDKTGTITTGQMAVQEIVTLGDENVEDAWAKLVALESNSNHPLAKAIVEHNADGNNIDVSDFENISGSGIKGVIDGEEYLAGNIQLIKNSGIMFDEKRLDTLLNEGNTIIVLAKKSQAVIAVALRDVIKKDSVAAIDQVVKMGIKPVMLTGDNEQAASHIAEQCHIKDWHAAIKPNEKEHIVADSYDLSAMVGDGINDAPSLASADIGISVASGTDIAIETSDVMLLNDSLNTVVKAIKLSKKVIANIYQNLLWAFLYNVMFIPVAAGVFYQSLGLTLTPMMGSLAMGLSSVCVVCNALRLNLLRKKLGGK